MTAQNEARDDEREALVWRNHPGLNQDAVGVRNADASGTQWYTVDRAREVIAELMAGLVALDGGRRVEQQPGQDFDAALYSNAALIRIISRAKTVMRARADDGIVS